jgi:RNA polymerase sigma factor (TIGR02999 family)
MAGSMMRSQSPGHTLQPTALVNEAYLRLVQGDTQWEGRAHFFGAAARAMRQVLMAHARHHAAQKRDGGVRVTFHDIDVAAPEPELDLLALDQALAALARVDQRYSRVMELRYFAGCTLPEIAELNGQSLATVKRDWAYARAWLYDHMNA